MTYRIKVVNPQDRRTDSYEQISDYFVSDDGYKAERAKKLREHTKRIRKELGIK